MLLIEHELDQLRREKGALAERIAQTDRVAKALDVLIEATLAYLMDTTQWHRAGCEVALNRALAVRDQVRDRARPDLSSRREA